MVNYEGKLKRAWVVHGTAGPAIEDQFHTLETGEIAKIFGVPMGMHPVVVRVIGLETQQTDRQFMYIWYDPDRLDNLLHSEITGYDIDNRVSAGLLGRKSHLLVADASDTYPSSDYGEYHVYNNIMLNKAAAAIWGVAFDYYLVPGAMMWLDEWAELLQDKQNVALNANNQAAGSRYYQVGDYYQIGKRTYD